MFTRRECLKTLEAGVMSAMMQPDGRRDDNGGAQARPNVIVIVADDHGSRDTGYFGARDLDTPTLDALAARGVRLDQFYSAAPVCSPSRAAVLTGRAPLRCGVTGNAA